MLPALGHIQVVKITAGMIDRTIDQWETEHLASTIKNSIAPLVRILDEAVRDGRVQDGQQLLMVVFGGGLSWAACTMKWWAGAPSLLADSGKQAPEQPAPGQVNA